MKLYTRNKISQASGRSLSAVRHWFFISQIEPTDIKKGRANTPTFLYSQEIFDKAVFSLKYKSKISQRVKERISRDIFCDLELRVTIPSKLNYLKLNQL